MNGTRPLGEGFSRSRSFLVQQQELGCHQVSAKNKEVNKVVMECFYRSKPFVEEGKPVRRYKERMSREWRERGLFESTECMWPRKGKLGKIDVYHNLNWKQLKDK